MASYYRPERASIAARSEAALIAWIAAHPPELGWRWRDLTFCEDGRMFLTLERNPRKVWPTIRS